MGRETPASKENEASVNDTLALVMRGDETSGGIRHNGDQDNSR